MRRRAPSCTSPTRPSSEARSGTQGTTCSSSARSAARHSRRRSGSARPRRFATGRRRSGTRRSRCSKAISRRRPTTPACTTTSPARTPAPAARRRPSTTSSARSSFGATLRRVRAEGRRPRLAPRRPPLPGRLIRHAGVAPVADFEARPEREEPSMGETVKYTLDESRLPEAWYNVAADLPEPPRAGAPPGHRAARRPRRPRAALPDGGDPPGGLDRAADPDPRGGPRRLPAVAPDSALPRATARARARDARTHLLQVRGRLAHGEPQAEHRRRAGVLQRARGREADRDGDRRRTVGLVPRVRGRALRARDRRLHGARLVRPEALPARADGGVRRALRSEPVRGDRVGPRDPRRAPGLDGEPRDRDLRGGRAGGAARGHEVRARLGAEPRPAPPDRDRRGGDRADGPRRGLPGRPHRLHGRRLELLGARVPVHRAEAPWRLRRASDRGRAGGVPEPDAGRVRVRLRRHRPPDAARQDAHARLDVRAARASTPAGSATTGWRRSSATSTRSG